MRVVGLDLSRTFAEIAYVEDGQVTAGGRVTLVHAALIEWAASQLRASDHVVLEATANTMAVVNAVRSRVARVVVANPCQVRLIAEARVKTDKIDAAVLAQLYASGFGLDPIRWTSFQRWIRCLACPAKVGGPAGSSMMTSGARLCAWSWMTARRSGPSPAISI